MELLLFDFLKLKEHDLFPLAESIGIRVFPFALVNRSVDIKGASHLIVIDVGVRPDLLVLFYLNRTMQKNLTPALELRSNLVLRGSSLAPRMSHNV